MTWLQARERTVEQWRRIYAHVGVWSLEEFLDAMSEEWPMCKKAREEAEKWEAHHCMCCLAFRQMGGCHDFMRELLREALRRHWDKVRTMVAQAINYWESGVFPSQNLRG